MHMLQVTHQLTHRRAVSLRSTQKAFAAACPQTQHLAPEAASLAPLTQQSTFCKPSAASSMNTPKLFANKGMCSSWPFCLLGIIQPFRLPPGTTAPLPRLSISDTGRQRLRTGLTRPTAGCNAHFCNHSWKPSLHTLFSPTPSKTLYISVILHSKCLSVQTS